MAQLKVTIEQMRSYVRSLDERLEDKQKYSNEWVDSKINTAYEITGTARQPWLQEEVLDLNPYVLDGTEKFQVDMDGDVQGYKRIYPELNGGTKVQPVGALNYGATAAQSAVLWKVEPDQSVHVTLDLSAFDTEVANNLVFQYYYFPTAPESETFVSADIYHMLRHGMEVSVYEALRDTEQWQIALSKLEDSAKTTVNGLDIDVGPYEGWNGGFPI